MDEMTDATTDGPRLLTCPRCGRTAYCRSPEDAGRMCPHSPGDAPPADATTTPANGLRSMDLVPALLEALGGYGDWRPPRAPDGLPMLNGRWTALRRGTAVEATVSWTSPDHGIDGAKLQITFDNPEA